jgi:hypothetical protein
VTVIGNLVLKLAAVPAPAGVLAALPAPMVVRDTATRTVKTQYIIATPRVSFEFLKLNKLLPLSYIRSGNKTKTPASWAGDSMF